MIEAKNYQMLSVYVFNVQGETEYVAANSMIQAILFYLGSYGLELDELDQEEDDVMLLPTSEWPTSEWPNELEEFMQEVSSPCFIASSVW